MFFMTLLKVVFTLLLCVPIVYLMITLLSKMIDDIVITNQKSGRRKDNSNRRRA